MTAPVFEDHIFGLIRPMWSTNPTPAPIGVRLRCCQLPSWRAEGRGWVGQGWAGSWVNACKLISNILAFYPARAMLARPILKMHACVSSP